MRLLVSRADKLEGQHSDVRAPAHVAGVRLGQDRGLRRVGAPILPLERDGPRGRAQGHPRSGGAADLVQQFLRLRRRCRVQEIRERRAATVVRLDRHAALAACRMRAHQRPPGTLMGAIDREQALRGGDQGVGIVLLSQEVLAESAATVAQTLPFRGEPGVEGRIGAVEVFQKIAVQQRQRGRLLHGRTHHLLHVHPGGAGPKGEVVAGDLQHVGASGREHLQQAVNFLAERRPGLLLRPAAPQQFREAPSQGGSRRGHRDDGQKGFRLTSPRQDVLRSERPGLHLADEPETENDRTRQDRRQGGRGSGDEGPRNKI